MFHRLSAALRLMPAPPPLFSQPQRAVHSKRTIKRMWGTKDKPHPARLARERKDRIRRGLNPDPKPPPPPPPPRFGSSHSVPTALANGWIPPHPAEALPPSIDLPFRITRSVVGGYLPVYTKYVAQRAVMLMIVRRIEGDVDALADELSRVVTAHTNAPRLVDVRKRQGSIEVKCDRGTVTHVRHWLASLGF
jgi:hypothetical protein